MTAVERIVSYLAGGTLAAFTLIILIEVLFRYWLHIPLSWPNELSILLFQWMVFLGAPIALRRGLHFTIEVGLLAMPERVQSAIRKFICLVTLVVGVALAALSVKMAVSTWHTTYTSLPIPVAVAFVGGACCGVLVALFSLPLFLHDPRKVNAS